MPKINREFIQSVFFLYSSADEARSGVNAKGTGFIVSYYGEHFGVTNRHVARDQGASVIRLNTKNGAPYIIEFDPIDWETIAGGDDIAVVALNLDQSLHEVSAIRTELFIPNHEERGYSTIGVGDDVFMIGLFVNHEGKEANNPLARFGNISMMASEQSPVYSGGQAYSSFIVDMHSRSGYSGSPVFVYRTFGGDLENPTYGHRVSVRAIDIARGIQRGGGFLQNDLYSLDGAGREIDLDLKSHLVLHLLGIHWMQFPEPWLIQDGISPYKEAAKYPGTEPKYIKGMSGMTGVAPAWKILEVIEMTRSLNSSRKQNPAPIVNDEPMLEARPQAMTGDDILRNMLNTPPDPKSKKTADS